MTEKNSLASILKRLREEKRKKLIERDQWTQDAVARRVGVTRQTYIAWEKGYSLPDIHNLPPIQNLYFTGRKAYLKQLDQFFHEGKKLIFLYGPIGIGKTKVALRYAQLRYIDYTYSAVFWIDASDEN